MWKQGLTISCVSLILEEYKADNLNREEQDRLGMRIRADLANILRVWAF